MFSSSLRLKTVTLPYLLEEARVLKRRTAKVVVLMPPAVEPGLPPINMRTVVSALPDSESFVKSMVLKPAVLGVTA